MKYFTGRSNPVEYTRSRAYQKNDNAHIEGKNWTNIGQYLGYQRFDKPEMVKMLNDIYENYWSAYFNFFIPSVNLLNKERVGSKIMKVHDSPKTPLQRVMESKDISPRIKKILQAKYKQFNPFELQSIIHTKILDILNLIQM
jgi:ATP-dependent Lon protease